MHRSPRSCVSLDLIAAAVPVARRLRAQMDRLFNATVSLTYEHEHGKRFVNSAIADSGEFWWDVKHPDQASLWESTIKLGEKFFHEIIAHPIPLDLHILKKLKRSPLGLDLYLWLTYRTFALKRPLRLTWSQLYRQFGADPDRPTKVAQQAFRRDCLRELEKIQRAWPDLHYRTVRGALVLSPSPPRIASSQLRLSDSDFPPTGRPCDEPRSGPSTLAARGAAGAPPASPAPRGLGTAPAAAAHRAEPRVGVRLRVRHLCESADAQVPDGRRRVDPRMPGDCRGRRHPLWAGDRGLAQLVSVHGAPRHLRSDNGPEFVATAILRWLGDAGIDTALIDPGKPWQNATDESFNGKFRNEFLSLQWFRNRMDAKVGIEHWRQHYNEVRPHSSLSYLTPAEFKAQLSAGSDDGGRCRASSTVCGPCWKSGVPTIRNEESGHGAGEEPRFT